MNLTVNSQALASELRLINKITPSKPAIAILGYVLLKADGDTLSFYATDLEIGLSTDCPASVDVPGSAVLPAAKFLQLVERFTDGDVSITADRSGVIVRCGAFKSKVQTLSVEDFPPQPEVEGPSNTLDADAFRRLIEATRYAVAVSSSKYVLRGALLALEGPAAAMVATDSKRLALATMGRAGTDQRLIIPAKALDILSVQLGGESLEMTVGARHLFFSSGNRVITSRTIDGEFPKYERIIPKGNDKVITIERTVLAAALRRMAVVSEDTFATYFTITDTLELTSSSAEVGSAAESVPIEYGGAPLKICINGSYVLDFLNAAVSRTIKLHLKDAATAALFTDGDDHVAVVMLMKS